MANPASPFGFIPTRRLGGGDPFFHWYFMSTSESNNAFVGDMVTLTAGAAPDGTPYCALLGAQAAPILGAIIAVDQVRGILDANFSLYKTYRTASIGTYVLVCDDPEAVYIGREDSTGNTLAAADLGGATHNVDVNYTDVAGSIITGVSGQQIDSSTHGNTAAQGLKLFRVPDITNNIPFTTYAIWEVLINNHPYKAGTGTV